VQARYPAPVQTGLKALPASYTVGIGSFLGVKRPGHGVEHPPTSSAEVKGRVKLYFYSPSRPSCPLLGRILLQADAILISFHWHAITGYKRQTYTVRRDALYVET